MKYVVNVPVCDLRREPFAHSNQSTKDPLQESQLLYGEHLLVKEFKDNWAYVEAVEQKKHANNRWTGYLGWLLRSQIISVDEFPIYNLVISDPWIQLGTLQLSFGTYLKGISKNEKTWTLVLADSSFHEIDCCHVKEIESRDSLTAAKRFAIMNQGQFFIANPYLWGGRSAFKKEGSQITSMDCSGLTNLLYRCEGLEIPRDAHDQYLQCKKIKSQDLQIADFVFTAPSECPERINHVMLYKHGDILLEATIDVGYIRWISGQEKLGKPLSTIKSGEKVGNRIIHFGTYT